MEILAPKFRWSADFLLGDGLAPLRSFKCIRVRDGAIGLGVKLASMASVAQRHRREMPFRTLP